MLIQIIGPERPHIDTEEIEGYCPKYCSKVNCTFYKKVQNITDNDNKELLIAGMCYECPLEDKKAKEFNKEKYHNEKNDYKIDEALLLTKSRLKQFLLYHAGCDTYGINKKLSINEIAKYLQYSVRTIGDNNKYFAENNLIYVCKINADRFSSAITNYKDYFKSKYEYGRGYIEIPKEIMLTLLCATNINEIRLILRGLIKNSQINSDAYNKIEAVSFSYNDIKNFLPRYINCPKKIRNVVSDYTKKIFITKFSDLGVELQLRPKLDNRVLKNINAENYMIKLIQDINRQARYVYGSWVDLLEITDMDKYMSDFVQMCQQYSYGLVVEGLNYLIELIHDTDYVGNYGGTVRNKIKELITGDKDPLAI